MTEMATCHGCDVKWPQNTRRAHCGACHATFGTPKSFDMHRWSRGRGWGCYDPATLELTLVDGTWYADCTGDDRKK